MTADGSSAQHHATASLITTFEKRAFARRCESYGVLVVMFGLLAAAAFVFVRAKAITIDETTQDLPTIAKTLQDKATVAAAGVDTIKEGFVTRLTDALKGLGDVHRLGTKYAPANFHIEMADDSAKLRSRGDVVTEIGRDFEKSSHDEIDYEVRVRGNPLPWIRVKVTRKDVHELESKPASWGQFDFSSDLTALAPLLHELDITTTALNSIVTNEKIREIDSLMHKGTDNGESNLSLPFLIQLNITRFGTISLVAIGLGLLSPLYRFSARLSAFYQARADALRLHQNAYTEIKITTLIAAFTPRFDFGKSDSGSSILGELFSIATKGKE